MGLDSIELVMEMEKYFQIQIPDQQAENISTVQDMVDAVARLLNITSTETTLRSIMFNKIQTALWSGGFIARPLEYSEPIFKIISPTDKIQWDLFTESFEYKIPKPEIVKKDPAGIWAKFKKVINWFPMYNWEEITAENFVDAVCAKNRDLLINPNAINNKYEIYIAVMRITRDKIGVDEYEVSPEKSFTNDLGVD